MVSGEMSACQILSFMIGNYFLHLDEFEEFIEGKFVIEKVQTFNLYYLLRVFTNVFANLGVWSKSKKRPNF